MAVSNNISRREFAKKSASGALTIASVLGADQLFGDSSLLYAKEDKKPAESNLEFRTLGRTGMKYTTLGFGAMRTSDPAVIRKAVDKGVNNIDTARGYMDGTNEGIVSKAIKDVRKQLFITTKIKVSNPSRMVEDLETSLRALETDYVDILLLHGLRDPDAVRNEEALNVQRKLREQGKIRFAGFSTHSNSANVIRASLRDKFFDVILVAYNFKSEEETREAIAEAAAANIGIIAMKTQGGGYEDKKMGNLSPHQAALKWVLADKNVTVAIPSMVTFDQVEENFQVMNSKMGWMDRKTLHRYGQVIDDKLCRMCGACDGQCPHGVQVADINRCLMYFEGYGDSRLAWQNYAEIAAAQNASRCSDCAKCVVNCAHGLDLAMKMNQAQAVFA